MSHQQYKVKNLETKIILRKYSCIIQAATVTICCVLILS